MQKEIEENPDGNSYKKSENFLLYAAWKSGNKDTASTLSIL